MNSDYFITGFAEGNFPSYLCPVCPKGNLICQEFKSESTAASQRASQEEWWEPEHDESVFRMTLKCTNCDGIVFVHGDGVVEEGYDAGPDTNWHQYFYTLHRPKYFFPPLKFVSCPAATPEKVRDHVESAAAMYFSHPAASCNSLRMAAEEILTSLGVPETPPGKFLSFSARIKQIPETSAEYGLLDALRWLGNAGSHTGSAITHKDAQDAFTVIDLLIEEVYSDRKRKIHELASAIRNHKGPVGRRDI